ncbi:MAG TPA: Crp/Fnr family transcriptional regulator [Chloroflexota bacterium]
MKVEPSVLAQVPLFRRLAVEHLRQLAGVAVRRVFRRGEIVFHKGDPGGALYLIREGQVKIVLPSTDGGEALLAVLGPGEFFGELSLFDGASRSATVVAVEPTETLVLRRDDFLGVLTSQPQVAIELLRVLSQRLRATDELIEDAVFLDLGGRLVKKLLELAESHGCQTPQGVAIRLRLTQQELASMVGASRESVNKHLSSLRARGLIALDRGQITLRRPDQLRRYLEQRLE